MLDTDLSKLFRQNFVLKKTFPLRYNQTNSAMAEGTIFHSVRSSLKWALNPIQYQITKR